MTDRTFDAWVRTRAQKEVFVLTEQTQNRLWHRLWSTPQAKRARRFTLRTALVAALVLALLTATALAVAQWPGVIELFERMFDDKRADDLRQETVQPLEQGYRLPDAEITLVDAVFDGSALYVSAHVNAVEGGSAVLIPMEHTPGSPFGLSESQTDVPDDAKTNAEVAQERGARLVRVDVHVDAQTAVDGGISCDLLLNTDGSFDSWWQIPNVAVSETGELRVTLTGVQWEVTDEGVPIEGTEARQEWPLTVPAIARTMATTTPAPTPLPVKAEAQQTALHVLGMSDLTDAAEAYAAAEPDAPVVYDSSWDGSVATMEQLAQWDVVCLHTDDPLYAQLVESGMLHDLSGVASGFCERLHAPIREAVTQDGAVYALPISLWAANGGNMLLSREMRFDEINAWQQAGFTDADAPETLDDLLSLIDRYASLSKTERKGIVFCHDAQAIRTGLTELALDLYLSDQNGVPTTFQDERLAALLRRIRQSSSGLKGEKEIGSQVVTWPAHPLQGAAHLSILRLFDQSPVRWHARLQVLVVNAQSPRIAQAELFVQAALDGLDWSYLAQMDQAITFDELDVLARQQGIAAYHKYAAWYQEQADSAVRERERKEAQFNADAQLEAAENIAKDPHSYIEWVHLIWPEDLAAYRANIAPYLAIGGPTHWADALTDWDAAHKLLGRYLTGKLDAPAFLRELDALLAN